MIKFRATWNLAFFVVQSNRNRKQPLRVVIHFFGERDTLAFLRVANVSTAACLHILDACVYLGVLAKVCFCAVHKFWYFVSVEFIKNLNRRLFAATGQVRG